MQEALDAGADYFMSKPFTYETFRELMAKRG
jgi:DNA-binding response OmpR family regulator